MKTLVELVFYQTSFVISPTFLYRLIRRDYGRLANEAFTSNPIVFLKQMVSSLKILNCQVPRTSLERPMFWTYVQQLGSVDISWTFPLLNLEYLILL